MFFQPQKNMKIITYNYIGVHFPPKNILEKIHHCFFFRVFSQLSFTTFPAFRYSHPTTLRPFCKSLKTSALVMMRARLVFSATFSNIWIKA